MKARTGPRSFEGAVAYTTARRHACHGRAVEDEDALTARQSKIDLTELAIRCNGRERAVRSGVPRLIAV